MRFLIQYVTVSVALVALAWMAAAVEVNGQTLVGHFLSSRVGTRVQRIIRKIVSKFSSLKGQAQQDAGQAPKKRRSSAPPPQRSKEIRPAVSRTAAPRGPPWMVQAEEGAYRRVTLLEEATQQANLSANASN